MSRFSQNKSYPLHHPQLKSKTATVISRRTSNVKDSPKMMRERPTSDRKRTTRPWTPQLPLVDAHTVPWQLRQTTTQSVQNHQPWLQNKKSTGEQQHRPGSAVCCESPCGPEAPRHCQDTNNGQNLVPHGHQKSWTMKWMRCCVIESFGQPARREKCCLHGRSFGQDLPIVATQVVASLQISSYRPKVLLQ